MARALLLTTLIAFSHGIPRIKRQSYGRTYGHYPSYNYGQQSFGGYYDNQQQQQQPYWNYQNEGYQNYPYTYQNWQQEDYPNYNGNYNDYWKNQMNTGYQQQQQQQQQQPQPRVNTYISNRGPSYEAYQQTTALPYRNSYTPSLKNSYIPPPAKNSYIPPRNSYLRPSLPVPPIQLPTINNYNPQPSPPVPPPKPPATYIKPSPTPSYTKPLLPPNPNYIPQNKPQPPILQQDPIPSEIRPSTNPQYPLSSNVGDLNNRPTQDSPIPAPIQTNHPSQPNFNDQPSIPQASNNQWPAGGGVAPQIQNQTPQPKTFMDSVREVPQIEVLPSDHVIGARSQQSVAQQTKPSEGVAPPVTPPWELIPIPSEQSFKPRGWPGFQEPGEPEVPMGPNAPVAPIAADVSVSQQPNIPVAPPQPPPNGPPMSSGMERPPDPVPAAAPPPRPPMPVQAQPGSIPSFG